MTAPADPRSLRVVRIIARLNLGGPARHVVLLDQGLTARGPDTLLVHGSVGPGEESLDSLARAARIRTVNIRALGRRLNVLNDAWTLAWLLVLMWREAPDVVHTHTAKAGALGRIAALAFNAVHRRRRQCAVIHTFHGHVLAGYFGPFGNAAVRLAERTLAKVTDRIVTISPSQQNDIVNRFKVASRRRTAMVPLGLDVAALLDQGPDAPDLRHELGIGASDIVVGFVGRMVPVKDLETLISAFARSLAAEPRLFLVLVGDGPMRPQLEAEAQRQGIAHRTRFVGWRQDLPAVYATLNVCALSSLNEGTPVFVIEAMAAGKAVVATAVGGVVDLIDDGATGLLVTPRRPDILAQAIVRLARDAEERRRIGEYARAQVGSRFSPERLVSAIEDLYYAALADRRRVGRPADSAHGDDLPVHVGHSAR